MWFSVLLEMFFIFIQHSIKPGEQFLGTVISMQDDWDSIDRSNSADIVRSSNSASDTSSLVSIGDAFA